MKNTLQDIHSLGYIFNFSRYFHFMSHDSYEGVYSFLNYVNFKFLN